jgi:hypothetical protein
MAAGTNGTVFTQFCRQTRANKIDCFRPMTILTKFVWFFCLLFFSILFLANNFVCALEMQSATGSSQLLTPQERLKRKMQAALNKQCKS